METQPIPPLDKPLALEFETKAANTIRMLAADGVQAANSGHPGMPMGMAAGALLTLWTRFDALQPGQPAVANRDRFVLSAGHGSMLLYSMLHLTGYDLPLEELKRFRQWGSKTPGHPEAGHKPAWRRPPARSAPASPTAWAWRMAERWLAQRFNRPGFEVDRSLHLRHRLRWRPDGRRRQRSRQPGRPSAPGQAHLSLRRQLDHHRRQDRRLLHRRLGQTLRGLWLARAARRRFQQQRRHLRRHR
jgi:hypothetical protein